MSACKSISHKEPGSNQCELLSSLYLYGSTRSYIHNLIPPVIDRVLVLYYFDTVCCVYYVNLLFIYRNI